jgi:hypothetical protein
MRKARTPLLLLLGCLLILGSACSRGDDNDDSDDSAVTATQPRATTAAGAATAATEATEDEATATPAATNTPARATFTPEPAATEPPAGDSTATPIVGGAGGNTGAEAELDEVKATIADVRGQELQHDVPAAILDRDQLRENMTRMFEEDYPLDEAERDTRIMWLLRLIEDRELDLHGLLIDLYSSDNVLGYYDSEQGELFLISDQQDELSGLAEMTMAHELTHALQDQVYDLESIRPEDMPADAGLAMTGLIETWSTPRRPISARGSSSRTRTGSSSSPRCTTRAASRASIRPMSTRRPRPSRSCTRRSTSTSATTRPTSPCPT